MDMDILAAEETGLDAIRRRARLHEGKRGLDRFVHHLAELAGGLDLSLAGHGHRFDGQQFAAHFGPGQAGDRTHLIFFLADTVAIFLHAGIFCQIVGRDFDALIFALENAAQSLARQLGDFAFQGPHAGFPRIIADQVAQGVLAQHELALFQAMRLDLLFDQMALGDFDLLVLGIALEPDDLHPVEQGLRQVQRVGGGHEHHVRQVDVDLEIMILELVILFRVEHLEQGRRRIATEILAELVDFVEQEQGIGGTRLLQVGDNLAGERSDIGPAMAADFRFVAHAAQ